MSLLWQFLKGIKSFILVIGLPWGNHRYIPAYKTTNRNLRFVSPLGDQRQKNAKYIKEPTVSQLVRAGGECER